MSVRSAEDFQALLVRSKLLEPPQLAAAARLAEVASSAQSLARRLVKDEMLTRWQAQQLLAGRHRMHLGGYRLLERVGQGRYGYVFRALQVVPRRIVALKILTSDVLDEPGATARFERELRLSQQLNHPNLVRAFEARSVGDVHFLSMEYVYGRNLKTWINDDGRLPIDWACECGRQAALALDYAHQIHLVHRDIKPSNLMVSAADTSSFPSVKVLDLGLAKLIDDPEEDAQHRITQTGQVLGTVDYIAPEQVESTKDVDIRADIFSLGCTLFKAITGRIPYAGASITEKLMTRLRKPAPALSRYRPEVSDELESVVAGMLATQPEERFQTPAEVVEALAPFSMAAEVVPEAEPLQIPLELARAEKKIGQLEDLVAQLATRLQGLERAVERPQVSPSTIRHAG